MADRKLMKRRRGIARAGEHDQATSKPEWENVHATGTREQCRFDRRRSSCEWAKLIRKLRWIGLDDEARRLELAVSTLPRDERGSVSVGPFSTD
jgi:hypothetical protein